MKILKVKCLAPTRLDNYLTQQFPALTPGRLNKALRENKIKLNGKKQPLSTRVMAGDEIKLFILDEVLDADRRVDGPAWKNARGPAQVVYDCPQIVVVNKPAGLAVDGPEDDTLLNRTLLYLNQQGDRQCIFLIDDFASELDSEKRRRLAQRLKQCASQVFITAIDEAPLADMMSELEGHLFHVEQGAITEYQARERE